MTASRVRSALVAWALAILVIALSGWVLLPFPRPFTGWVEIDSTIGFTPAPVRGEGADGAVQPSGVGLWLRAGARG